MYKREAVPRRCGRIFYCDGKQCFVPQDSPAARPTCVLIFSRVPCCRAKADSPATAVCLSWGNPNSLRRSCLVFQRRGRKEDGEERVGFHIPKGEDIYTFFSELLPSQCPGKVAEPLEETTAQDTYKCWIPKLWYTETSEL